MVVAADQIPRAVQVTRYGNISHSLFVVAPPHRHPTIAAQTQWPWLNESVFAPGSAVSVRLETPPNNSAPCC